MRLVILKCQVLFLTHLEKESFPISGVPKIIQEQFYSEGPISLAYLIAFIISIATN